MAWDQEDLADFPLGWLATMNIMTGILVVVTIPVGSGTFSTPGQWRANWEGEEG